MYVPSSCPILTRVFFPLLPPGVALLSSEYPEQVLPTLLARYGRPAQDTEDTPAAVSRMKLGEVLMRVTRALGESAATLCSLGVTARPVQGAVGSCSAVLCHPWRQKPRGFLCAGGGKAPGHGVALGHFGDKGQQNPRLCRAAGSCRAHSGSWGCEQMGPSPPWAG